MIDFAGGSYADFFGTYTKQTDTANDFSAYKADVGTRGIWYTGSSWIIGSWASVGGGSGNAFNDGDSICVHDMTAAWAWTYFDWNTGTTPAAGQGLGIRCTDTTPTASTPTCADIWSASKCKEKEKAGECDTSCTTDDCVKTQAKCKKKCKIC